MMGLRLTTDEGLMTGRGCEMMVVVVMDGLVIEALSGSTGRKIIGRPVTVQC